MNNISLTIPMDYLALTRASDMLHGLAVDIEKERGASIEEITQAEINAGNLPGKPVIENAPVTLVELEVPNVAAGVVEKLPTPIVNGTPVAAELPDLPAPTSDNMPTTESVDPLSLDAEGIPWDARIHTASKMRLARGDTWKLIRGIEKKSPGLVEQVKAELKHRAQGVYQEEPTPEIAVNIGEQVAPVEPTPAAQVFTTPAPVDIVAPVVAPVATIDFAGLTEKITARLPGDQNYMTTVEGVLTEFGIVGGLSMVLGKDELLQQINARLDQLCQG